ncbi:MAG: 50S ribosomal protein L23 [Thermodesulfobacteriota bacterium]
MAEIYSIIKAPVITEKATALSAEGNKVVFWVEPAANKKEIKTAVEKLFNVKVEGVNTERLPRKTKRLGKFAGRTVLKKKAYVTLREGQKIEIFETK